MIQILQNLGFGETLLGEVPAPRARMGHLLIRTETSLVSLGTEKVLVSFGQANLLEKARQQPEKVECSGAVICDSLPEIGEFRSGDW